MFFYCLFFQNILPRIAVRIEVLSGERNHPHCWRTGSNPLSVLRAPQLQVGGSDCAGGLGGTECESSLPPARARAASSHVPEQTVHHIAHKFRLPPTTCSAHMAIRLAIPRTASRSSGRGVTRSVAVGDTAILLTLLLHPY